MGVYGSRGEGSNGVMSRVGKQWGGLRADLLGLEPDVHPVRVRGHQVLEHCATGAQLLQHEAGGK